MSAKPFTLRQRENLRRRLPSGPCAFCDSMSAAHRVVDGVRYRLKAGDTIAELSADYGLSRNQIKYLTETPLRQLNWLRRMA